MQYVVKMDEFHKANIEQGLELLYTLRKLFRISGQDAVQELLNFYRNDLDSIKPNNDDRFVYVDIVKRRKRSPVENPKKVST